MSTAAQPPAIAAIVGQPAPESCRRRGGAASCSPAVSLVALSYASVPSPPATSSTAFDVRSARPAFRVSSRKPAAATASRVSWVSAGHS